jgi:hypothetical protein
MLQDFVKALQIHLLSRLQNPYSFGPNAQDFTDVDHSTIIFPNPVMYRHSTLRVNYTSYDVRRAANVISPRSKHHFIMLYSGDDISDHAFWYAKVLGIYHTTVLWLEGSGTRVPRRMNFLWVRWMEVVVHGSWERCQLDRVRYVPTGSYREMYGFVDPACVIRACHLVPAFHFGRARTWAKGSLGLDDPTEGDWDSYYVNR